MEWFFLGLSEIVKAAIGCIWLGMLLGFVLFIYNYFKFYDLGVRQGKKGALLSYRDMDKKARQIVMGFIMFLITTYLVCWINYDKFLEIVVRGICAGALVFPLLNTWQGKVKFKGM